MYIRSTAVISNPTGLCVCILKSLCVCVCEHTCYYVCVHASEWECVYAAYSCMEEWSIITIEGAPLRFFPAPLCSTYCILTPPERVSTVLAECVLTCWTYEHAFVPTPGCISVYFWNYGFTSPQVACWTISRLLFPSSACPAALAPTVPQTQVPFCGSTLNSFN